MVEQQMVIIHVKLPAASSHATIITLAVIICYDIIKNASVAWTTYCIERKQAAILCVRAACSQSIILSEHKSEGDSVK